MILFYNFKKNFKKQPTMSVKLSPIIAGVMNWGVWDKNLNTNEMNHLINLFFENGITSFDHADICVGVIQRTLLLEKRGQLQK